MTPHIPFYDPSLSYEDNYQKGPFGLFAKMPEQPVHAKTTSHFAGFKVNTPFGIPAGPLLNGQYVKAALAYGFDLCVYKTVRTVLHKSHPLPNVLSIHPKGKLSSNLEEVLADTDYDYPLSITNSFGVPSFAPDIWQPDMADAVKAAKDGQYVIGSFQGTQGQGTLEDDYARAAKLVAETGAPILEANLSCPNEGASKLLCFDFDKVERVAHAIKNAVPDRPLFMKLAYFADEDAIRPLIEKLGNVIEGFSAINTLSARPVKSDGQPALGPNRPEGGVCGEAIRWAGLDMVQHLSHLRQKLDMKFSIIGVGGVSSPTHYQAFINAGADAVMSATGAMWNPNLAFDIKRAL